VKKRQGLDWVLGMLVLAVLDDLDDEPVGEIRGGIDNGLDEGPPLIHWLCEVDPTWNCVAKINLYSN
jgi:hypothetical protein